MIGVASMLKSARGPRLSVLNRHAILSVFALSLLIWSSGEYFVLPGSPAYARHSPFFAPLCAVSGSVAPTSKQTASNF